MELGHEGAEAAKGGCDRVQFHLSRGARTPVSLLLRPFNSLCLRPLPAACQLIVNASS